MKSMDAKFRDCYNVLSYFWKVFNDTFVLLQGEKFLSSIFIEDTLLRFNIIIKSSLENAMEILDSDIQEYFGIEILPETKIKVDKGYYQRIVLEYDLTNELRNCILTLAAIKGV